MGIKSTSIINVKLANSVFYAYVSSLALACTNRFKVCHIYRSEVPYRVAHDL